MRLRSRSFGRQAEKSNEPVMKKLLLLFLLPVIGMATLSAQTTLKPVRDRDTDLWGFVNSRGEWAIAPCFEAVMSDRSFTDAFTTSSSKIGIVKYKGKWACIDRKGQFLTKPIFVNEYAALNAATNIKNDVPLGKWVQPLKDGDTELWGFINYLGNWVILPQFEAVLADRSFTDDFTASSKDAGVVKYRGKWGAVDKAGRFLVQPVFPNEYDALSAVSDMKKSGSIPMIPYSQLPNYADAQGGGQQSDAQQTATQKPTGPRPSASAETKAGVSALAEAQKAMSGQPKLRIISPQSGSTYDTEVVSIKYEAKSAGGAPVALIVTVDGEPYDMNTKGVRRAGQELTIPLPRKEGQRKIMIMAKDGDNFSEPQFINLTYVGEKRKPTLYTLAIGVGEYNDPKINRLMFGAKDASDVAATIRNVKTNVYDKVAEPVVLTDKDATTANIRDALEDMVNRPRQDDVVIIYMSGHAVPDARETYFLSSDARSDRLFSSAVRFSEIDHAMNLLVDRQCKVIVFMDACHAAQLYGANTKSVNETIQLAEPSIIGFYSSTAGQKSVEKKEWGNSAFTRALIDGINGKAMNDKKEVTTKNLEGYIYETVTGLTNSTQKPIVKTEVGHYVLF